MEPRIHIQELKISSLLLCMTVVQMKPVRIFGFGEDVKVAVVQWIQQQSMEFLTEVIHLLVGQWVSVMSVSASTASGYWLLLLDPK